MDLKARLDLLIRLGEYMKTEDEKFELVKEKARIQNSWFTNEFINLSISNISNNFLKPDALNDWVKNYRIKDKGVEKKVGIVMAGNIPLVGFHDILCVFVSGHAAVIKASSKDEVLINHLVKKICEWEPAVFNLISFAENLKACDAFIATGSNNSARYFEYYFRKYPSIIRRNRTSVALLEGNETKEELDLLADDVQLYFGLGCRNVTQLYIPRGYNFIPLLEALKKYNYFMNVNKYRNNYEYQYDLLIMNNKFHMSNESFLLFENEALFSPVSVVNYSFYDNKTSIYSNFTTNANIQCVISRDHIPFGRAQFPQLNDYADRVDTMEFLCTL